MFPSACRISLDGGMIAESREPSIELDQTICVSCNEHKRRSQALSAPEWIRDRPGWRRRRTLQKRIPAYRDGQYIDPRPGLRPTFRLGTFSTVYERPERRVRAVAGLADRVTGRAVLSQQVLPTLLLGGRVLRAIALRLEASGWRQQAGSMRALVALISSPSGAAFGSNGFDNSVEQSVSQQWLFDDAHAGLGWRGRPVIWTDRW